jgi:integrase
LQLRFKDIDFTKNQIVVRDGKGQKDRVTLLPESIKQQRSLLSKLGKHKMGKALLYFKQLADLDRSALERLVIGSVAEAKRRYG